MRWDFTDIFMAIIVGSFALLCLSAASFIFMYAMHPERYNISSHEINENVKIEEVRS